MELALRGNSNSHALALDQDAETKRDDEAMDVFLTVATEARDQINWQISSTATYMEPL
jgi:hypothetical protein